MRFGILLWRGTTVNHNRVMVSRREGFSWSRFGRGWRRGEKFEAFLDHKWKGSGRILAEM